MSTNTLKTRIKHAYKTESEWTSSNPVLLEGEVVYNSGDNRYKVGDGTSTWSQLPYASVSVTKDSITEALGYVPAVSFDAMQIIDGCCDDTNVSTSYNLLLDETGNILTDEVGNYLCMEV